MDTRGVDASGAAARPASRAPGGQRRGADRRAASASAAGRTPAAPTPTPARDDALEARARPPPCQPVVPGSQRELLEPAALVRRGGGPRHRGNELARRQRRQVKIPKKSTGAISLLPLGPSTRTCRRARPGRRDLGRAVSQRDASADGAAGSDRRVADMRNRRRDQRHVLGHERRGGSSASCRTRAPICRTLGRRADLVEAGQAVDVDHRTGGVTRRMLSVGTRLWPPARTRLYVVPSRFEEDRRSPRGRPAVNYSNGGGLHAGSPSVQELPDAGRGQRQLDVVAADRVGDGVRDARRERSSCSPRRCPWRRAPCTATRSTRVADPQRAGCRARSGRGSRRATPVIRLPPLVVDVRARRARPPTPWAKPPSTCPSASSGLSSRPASWTVT